MQKISDARNDHDEWWGSHFPYEGDLVGMSYLFYEKQFHKHRQRIYKPRVCGNDSNINLVVWGDSYTQYIGDTCFCASKYKFARRYFSTLEYTLDSNCRNVMLIEITERLVREYFANKRMFDEVKHFVPQKLSYNTTVHAKVYTAGIQDMPYFKVFFNENINQNIEYNLFNYNFMSASRKIKAWMNYKVFNRASGDAVLADDGDRLFLKATTGNKELTGYATPLSDDEINNIVQVLNDIDAHYRQEGFGEVYLALIPNAITIYQPQKYNMLIPRIQQHPDLKIKFVDIYTTFRQHPENMYWRGDTHWSNAGADVWLKMINRILTDSTYRASL